MLLKNLSKVTLKVLEKKGGQTVLVKKSVFVRLVCTSNIKPIELSYIWVGVKYAQGYLLHRLKFILFILLKLIYSLFYLSLTPNP